MRYAAGKNNTTTLCAFVLLLSVAIASRVMTAPYAHAQSAIGATVCNSQPTISLSNPASDSVVTNPTLTVDGSVSQASQIEIRVDDVFDSIIPLTIGQETFSGDVSLPAGTHTIKATAINVCPGPNVSASVVVTFEAPPSTSSNGSSTDTTVAGDSPQSGVVVGDPGVEQVSESPKGNGFFGGIEQWFQGATRWLDVGLGGDKPTTGQVSAMSPGSAVLLTAGLSVAILGIAPAVLQPLASLGVVVNTLPAATPVQRLRFLSIAGRLIGFGVAVGALFL